jgi:hypothetical protein
VEKAAELPVEKVAERPVEKTQEPDGNGSEREDKDAEA